MFATPVREFIWRRYSPKLHLGDTDAFAKAALQLLGERGMNKDELWDDLHDRMQLQSKRHLRKLLQWMKDMQMVRTYRARGTGDMVFIPFDVVPPKESSGGPLPQVKQIKKKDRNPWKPEKLSVWLGM